MQFGPVMEVQHLHQELAASRARVQSLEEQLEDVRTGVKKAENFLLTYDNIKEDSEPLQFLTGLPSGVWTALWDFLEPSPEYVLRRSRSAKTEAEGRQIQLKVAVNCH